MFGQFVDRYASDAYGPPVGTLAAVALAGQVRSLSVVDINFPFDAGVTAQDVKNALDRAALRAIAVTPHIYTRQFRRGAFTNPDPTVRRAAMDLCRQAIEAAKVLGAEYVKFWPGQDGFDYPLQADYLELWDLSVSAIGDLARAEPSMNFAIEYKAREAPRAHHAQQRLAHVACHSGHGRRQRRHRHGSGPIPLLAKETPAEELRLIARRGKLRSVEVNDNWRDWDDDLTVGAVHLVETLEFLIALRRIDWHGPILLDQFPFREDPVGAARRSIDNGAAPGCPA